MISSSLLARQPKTIAIVGNGPVTTLDAPKIDEADLVLRFNGARACGAAGQRVDILLLNRARVYMSKRINPVALHRAEEVWVNDTEKNGQVDWLFDRECKACYLGLEATEKARKRLQKYDPFLKSNPTTGAAIVAEFLDSLTDTEINLFGFTHQGRQHTHDWDAEKRWFADLITEGALVSHSSSGPLARRSLAGHATYCARFLEKRTKHYLFNRVLHSGEATKRRIFGVDASA